MLKRDVIKGTFQRRDLKLRKGKWPLRSHPEAQVQSMLPRLKAELLPAAPPSSPPLSSTELQGSLCSQVSGARLYRWRPRVLGTVFVPGTGGH